MSSSFTPSGVVDMTKEKDWPANLGMLDWDSTSIVFTKRSLMEFLKYAGTTVDPNFTNIAKLPRYAKFDAPAGPLNDFKPSRRVRMVPGGPHSNIFDFDTDDDALSLAPLRPATPDKTPPAPAVALEEESGIDFGTSFKPSRRVRTNPGGNSTMSNFWDPAEVDQFKPTRRVRQGPGGQDNINEIF
ncbi:hypothetical protein BDZ94DRAFT_1005173 [Collybia nuda]|uniref:Uncharacterized protein n=1 Tax=Collybia nuda TaxID=64659 RepID=A0A9P5Y1B7_9AGAR|nr:hypothetical protein BDZ94DRAFT_1005173 [Collybia nuda]